MIKDALSLFGNLKPPHPLENGSEDLAYRTQLYEVRVRGWRWAMFYWLIGLTGMSALHIALVCGYAPLLFPGFALASDQKTTQTEVTQMRVEQLDARLFDLRKDQCAAIKENKPPGVYTRQIQPLMSLYFELTRKEYRLPTCAEL